MAQVTVIWNGREFPVPCDSQATVLEVLLLLDQQTGVLRRCDLALFTMGGIELGQDYEVRDGDEYVLREAVIH